MRPYIIGIAGGSGSGKSTFTDRIAEEFKSDTAVLYFDNYYKRQDNLSHEERIRVNYDHPDALETDLLALHLKELKNGRSVLSPIYDFAEHNRSDKVAEIKPNRIIIVEGILTLQCEIILELLDLKIYVETDADERILRRVQRDTEKRGRKLDDIISQYLNTVKPMHYLYVEPSKANADIILNGGLNDAAFDIVKCKIKSLLN